MGEAGLGAACAPVCPRLDSGEALPPPPAVPHCSLLQRLCLDQPLLGDVGNNPCTTQLLGIWESLQRNEGREMLVLGAAITTSCLSRQPELTAAARGAASAQPRAWQWSNGGVAVGSRQLWWGRWAQSHTGR